MPITQSPSGLKTTLITTYNLYYYFYKLPQSSEIDASSHIYQSTIDYHYDQSECVGLVCETQMDGPHTQSVSSFPK